jgi:hypothetical protein
MKGQYMKTAKREEMRTGYRREDLDAGVRGKYFNEYKKGTNLILLSPDVAAAFQNEDTVNAALRNLIKLAKQSIVSTKRPIKKHVAR